jgi:hypothetical protein
LTVSIPHLFNLKFSQYIFPNSRSSGKQLCGRRDFLTARIVGEDFPEIEWREAITTNPELASMIVVRVPPGNRASGRFVDGESGAVVFRKNSACIESVLVPLMMLTAENIQLGSVRPAWIELYIADVGAEFALGVNDYFLCSVHGVLLSSASAS